MNREQKPKLIDQYSIIYVNVNVDVTLPEMFATLIIVWLHEIELFAALYNLFVARCTKSTIICSCIPYRLKFARLKLAR